MPEPSVPGRLRERLAVLEPVAIEIEDDSAKHAGHAGARQGGHYNLRLVSAKFAGRSALERHRLVYGCLGDLQQLGIHALSMRLSAPGET